MIYIFEINLFYIDIQMITDYFKSTKNLQPIITEYYELHRSFIERNKFSKLFNEIYPYLQINSSRKSCVCLDHELKKTFNIYKLPLVDWTLTIDEIKNSILTNYSNLYPIDYGLVHYYENSDSNISWHSDREALKSNIYSISIGGTRCFCLREKNTKKVISFNLFDGDLFVMKIGCQDKYDHCIKSMNLFNEPRISITFRQIETPTLYYTYNPSIMEIIITEECPNSYSYNYNYTKITETRQKIVIGIISNENENENENKKFLQFSNTKINVSLVKSNLQKSIRRKLENIALSSAMAMIISGNSLNLLRRLTIISIEDVCINKYYCIIVWYYIAISKNYELTNFDVNFIFSYVKLLCSINIYYENINDETINDENINNKNINNNLSLSDLYNNVNCIALYLRLQFGGFNGEKKLINKIIYGIMNNTINICNDELLITNYQIYENELDILSCAIDFHCFPKMVEKILSKIKNDDPTTELNEDDIRKYIWIYDSNVNVRINNVCTDLNMNTNTWINIIKPKCDVYRYHIMKLLNLDKLL